MFVLTKCDRCQWGSDYVIVTSYGRLCRGCFTKTMVEYYLHGLHAEPLEIRGYEVSGEDFPRTHLLPEGVRLPSREAFGREVERKLKALLFGEVRDDEGSA